jgi:hypothetical protein
MNAIKLTEKYYAIEINSRIRSDKCFKSKMFFSYYMQDRFNYGCVQLAKIVKRKHNMIVYYKGRKASYFASRFEIQMLARGGKL